MITNFRSESDIVDRFFEGRKSREYLKGNLVYQGFDRLFEVNLSLRFEEKRVHIIPPYDYEQILREEREHRGSAAQHLSEEEIEKDIKEDPNYNLWYEAASENGVFITRLITLTFKNLERALHKLRDLEDFYQGKNTTSFDTHNIYLLRAKHIAFYQSLLNEFLHFGLPNRDPMTTAVTSDRFQSVISLMGPRFVGVQCAVNSEGLTPFDEQEKIGLFALDPEEYKAQWTKTIQSIGTEGNYHSVYNCTNLFQILSACFEQIAFQGYQLRRCWVCEELFLFGQEGNHRNCCSDKCFEEYPQVNTARWRKNEINKEKERILAALNRKGSSKAIEKLKNKFKEEFEQKKEEFKSGLITEADMLSFLSEKREEYGLRRNKSRKGEASSDVS